MEKLLFRKGLSELMPAIHGGMDYSELEALGLKPGDILDFSANLNPFGPPKEVKEALKGVDFSSYPDSGSSRLRKALADKLGLDANNIIAGSGSTEIMRLAALAFFKSGDRVLIIKPTFGEYEVSCLIAGAEIIEYNLKMLSKGNERGEAPFQSASGGPSLLRKETGKKSERLFSKPNFNLDVSEIVKLIKKTRPAGLFFANPNNPTGQYYPRNLVEKLISARKDWMVVLDEAYLSFVENPWPSLSLIKDHNLLILRSMTKDFSLAGLRLGYGIARREIIYSLQRICPPWNVNVMAQEAGLRALKAKGFLEKSLKEISKAKAYLVEGLRAIGLLSEPSQTNFLLVKTGSGALWRQELLKRKILVRDCSSFGLPEYIRISVRSKGDCDKLIEAIRDSDPIGGEG